MTHRNRSRWWRLSAVALAIPILAPLPARATLILTAICDDGVFIRSDKRNQIKYASKPVEYHDNLNKVFVSADKRIIIYNHGINRINRITWREQAATLAAKLQSSAVADIHAAMDVVEATLASDMAAEFARNKLDDFSAFVVVIRLADGRYRAGEVSWRKKQPVHKQALGRYICSGSGGKYVRPASEQQRDEHWAALTVEQAQSEIAELYDAAVRRQAEAKGTEFSPAHDDLTVTK